jgi:phosphohistidine phosphatase SixA
MEAWAGAPHSPATRVLRALVPDADPARALTAVTDSAGEASHALAVAHQPLLGRIVLHACGVERSLPPGTLVRIEWAPGDLPGTGRVISTFGPA